MKAKDVSKKISSVMNEAKPQLKLKPGQGASSFTLMNAAVDCLRAAGMDSQADKLVGEVMRSGQDYTNTKNIIRGFVEFA